MTLSGNKRDVPRIDSCVSVAVSWRSTARLVRASPSTPACERIARMSIRSLFVAALAFGVAGCSSKDAKKQDAQVQTAGTKIEKAVNYCALVSKDELAKIYRKPLFSTPTEHGCMWSEKPGGMAALSLDVREYQSKIRTYFPDKLPNNVKLVAIKDLGDSGLMTVVDGDLGVIVARKGTRVLQSAATFLELKPGSAGQKVLWQIYQRALDQ